jgi:hypothetical protein
MQESSADAQTMVESELYFGPFCLEAAKQLWCGDQRIDLRPRSLAMLQYLAERPGRLITKEELLKQLWPGIYVSSTVSKCACEKFAMLLGMRPRSRSLSRRWEYRDIGSSPLSPPPHQFQGPGSTFHVY